jgi:hypothetical protein
MSEHPAYTVTETPVLDPNLFLLNRANRAFIERRNDTPILNESSLDHDASRFGGIVLFIFTTVIILSLVRNVSLEVYRLSVFIIALSSILAFFWAYVRYMCQSVGIKGWILPGEVLHSEKIRVIADKTWHEQVGVRFQYTTPDGVLTIGYAEGGSDRASDNMAPAPGTPVRVWYGDDGEIFLL